jgi:hypothetical protein
MICCTHAQTPSRQEPELAHSCHTTYGRKGAVAPAVEPTETAGQQVPTQSQGDYPSAMMRGEVLMELPVLLAASTAPAVEDADGVPLPAVHQPRVTRACTRTGTEMEASRSAGAAQKGRRVWVARGPGSPYAPCTAKKAATLRQDIVNDDANAEDAAAGTSPWGTCSGNCV